MIRLGLVCLLGMLLIGLSACRERQANSQPAVSEQYIADPSSVGFDIAPLPSGNGSVTWLATYASQGKTAKFRIELDSATPNDSSDTGGIRVEFGKGRIQAEPGSDASVLLSDLKKALEAQSFPTHVRRSSSLPFTYAILGENQSQSQGGGFNTKPAGHWTAMKIFVGSGNDNDDGEVFLNFNTVMNKAQFSIKDPDYGNYVLAKLATVL